MQTKLTLRLDEALVRRAKAHSRLTGRSVSQMVADYFRVLDVPGAPAEDTQSTPLVASLRGILADAPVDESDYRRHLVDKHR